MDAIADGDGTPLAYATNHLVFAREQLTLELIAEVTPLIMAHYREVATHQDIPLDPYWEMYFSLQEAGRLRIWTARDGQRLVGYNAFFVGKHLHYKTCDMATNDVFFVDPAIRGLGKFLRRYAECKLRDEGFQVEAYHVKKAHAQWEAGLERDGFVAIETIWVKRLDQDDEPERPPLKHEGE